MMHAARRRASAACGDAWVVFYTATRATQGLERMEQVKLAVLERSGGISVVPRR